MNRKNFGLGLFFAERANLIAVILTACGLGFGISTLASIFVAGEIFSHRVSAAIAISAILGAGYYFYRTFSGSLSFKERITGVIFTDENSEPLPVMRYDFMQSFQRILSAIKVENKAIYADWTAESLNDWKQSDFKKSEAALGTEFLDVDDDEFFSQNSAAKLAEEISFYIALDWFSTHLSDYFLNSGLESQTTRLERKDLPAFLLENRVINLLSTPIEQREIFLDKRKSSKKPKGRLVAAFGPGGAYFNEFDLVLPIGSSVKPLGHNGIEIDNPLLNLKMTATMTPFGHFIGADFKEYYLHTKESMKERTVWFDIEANIKPSAVFKMHDHSLYGWLDSFRYSIRENADFDEFLKYINWNTVRTLLFSLGVAKKASVKSAQSK